LGRRGGSLAAHPVCRPPFKTHDRKNPDTTWLDLVEKGIRESMEEATTDGATEDHPGFGMALNGL
jgi:hypothetical protein